MARANLENGTFPSGIPYLRYGRGPRTLLFLAGGPGNHIPSGFGAAGFTRALRPFRAEYTIYLVGRKTGLPAGYTTRRMAADVAELIRTRFGGHVDLVIGFSFGGLIAQHLAADFPALFGHLVIAGAAHEVSAAARRIDLRYAQLIHAGRDRAAMALRADAVAPPGLRRALLRLVLWLFGRRLMGDLDPTFRDDIVVEAQAELAHDARAALARISVPVLVVAGEGDFAFPIATVQEMARRIPRATLQVYPRGHTTVFLEPRFAADIRTFAAETG